MNDSRTRRSQRFFNLFMLAFYDLILYRFISRVFWQCEPEKLVKLYRDNLSKNHLDVGVGTGYLLRHSISNTDAIELALMDLNQNCLDKTEKSIYPLKAKKYQRNILHEIEGIPRKFSSISVNYVMHCVPGNFKTKGMAFDNLKQILDKNGTLFGSSVLSKGVHNPIHSAALMWIFNKIGLFDNDNDSLEDLRHVLGRNFAHVEITEAGPAVLFRASDHEFESMDLNNGNGA